MEKGGGEGKRFLKVDNGSNSGRRKKEESR